MMNIRDCLRPALLASSIILSSGCTSNVHLDFDAEKSLNKDVTTIQSGSFSSWIELTKIRTLSGILNFFVDMNEIDIAKIREVRSDIESKQKRLESVELSPLSLNGVETTHYHRADSESEKVILSLHGGAYTSGSPVSPYWLNTNIMSALNLDLVSPDYRLAPENPYPAAVDDAESVYRALLEDYESANIVVVGESAGGGLALALLLRAKKLGLPLPGGLILFSPWTDVGLTSDSILRNKEKDFLNPVEIQRWANAYVADNDVSNPEISPVYGSFQGSPPILIMVGTEEIIQDDSARLHDVLTRDNVTSKLQIWEGMWHIWPNAPADAFPEVLKTMEVCGAFYRSYIH